MRIKTHSTRGRKGKTHRRVQDRGDIQMFSEDNTDWREISFGGGKNHNNNQKKKNDNK